MSGERTFRRAGGARSSLIVPTSSFPLRLVGWAERSEAHAEQFSNEHSMQISIAPNPSLKDVAEFYRLMLGLDLCEKATVVHWADRVIESTSKYAEWTLELSWSSKRWKDEIESQLSAVPGEITDDLPRKMVAAVFRRRWLRQAISDEDFVKAWYRLYPEYPEDSLTRHAAEIWQYLDNVIMSIYAGDRISVSLSEARVRLRELLEPYAPYERLLPAIDGNE